MDPQISARFSLRGRFEPDDVTRLIGLQPTKTWRRGDMRTRVRAWEWDGWAIELDPEDSVDLPQMTERLLAILEPFVTAINTAVGDGACRRTSASSRSRRIPHQLSISSLMSFPRSCASASSLTLTCGCSAMTRTSR